MLTVLSTLNSMHLNRVIIVTSDNMVYMYSLKNMIDFVNRFSLMKMVTGAVTDGKLLKNIYFALKIKRSYLFFMICKVHYLLRSHCYWIFLIFIFNFIKPYMFAEVSLKFN